MADPIRLLMLTHNYPRFRGDFAGVFIALLAKRLLEFDIQPVILAPHDPGAPEFEETDGIRVYRFRYAQKDEDETIAYRGNMHKLVLGSVSGIFKFKQFLDRFRGAALKVIDEERIDIVAGHWLIPSGIVMRTIMRKRNLPMIMSSHGTDIRLMRKYFRVTYRYLRTFCMNLKRWTVVSNFLKEGIVDLDPRLKDKIEVLPLPHDEELFYRDESIPREDSLVVAVTRFTGQKRVTNLIKAFALVAERSHSARLEIYGTGPMQQDVESLIDKFGLQDRVKIFPPVAQADLRTVYNRASIVVLNSFQDGFGLALSESMMCGAAVIGTDSGGITDIIRHGERGLLVPLDDNSALAEAMLLLLEDPQMRRNLAQNGYEYARKTFAATPLACRFAEIIRDALR
jgi:glycosyltransferase involved in cell wall biosynthesis